MKELKLDSTLNSKLKGVKITHSRDIKENVCMVIKKYNILVRINT